MKKMLFLLFFLAAERCCGVMGARSECLEVEATGGDVAGGRSFRTAVNGTRPELILLAETDECRTAAVNEDGLADVNEDANALSLSSTVSSLLDNSTCECRGDLANVGVCESPKEPTRDGTGVGSRTLT
jgi:hypothetical protein